MFNRQIISKLMEENKVTKLTLYKAVGLSKKGLEDLLNGTTESPRAWVIEGIADFFHIPIDYLFTRNIDVPSEVSIGHQVKGNGNSVFGDISLNECRKEIEHLNALLEEKERTIQILLNK